MPTRSSIAAFVPRRRFLDFDHTKFFKGFVDCGFHRHGTHSRQTEQTNNNMLEQSGCVEFGVPPVEHVNDVALATLQGEHRLDFAEFGR